MNSGSIQEISNFNPDQGIVGGAWNPSGGPRTVILKRNLTGDPVALNLYLASLKITQELPLDPGDIVSENTVIDDGSGSQVSIPLGTEVTFPAPGQQISMETPPLPVDPSELPAGITDVVAVRKFEPSGTTFNPPITLTISYTNAEVAGLDEASLKVLKYSAITGKYDIELPIVSRDLTNNKITAQISAFSNIGVGGSAASPPPPPPPGVYTCFIATATYGSYLDPHVEILRQFRDQYLVTNWLGNRMVSLYYQYSPPIAYIIAQHELLKTIVKIGLLPLVGISTFCIKTTIVQKVIMLMALFSLITLVAMMKRFRHF